MGAVEATTLTGTGPRAAGHCSRVGQLNLLWGTSLGFPALPAGLRSRLVTSPF